MTVLLLPPVLIFMGIIEDGNVMNCWPVFSLKSCLRILQLHLFF